MTFEQWQETRAIANLEDYTYSEQDYGYVYDDGSFIQECEDGTWWTVSGSQDILVNSRDEAEKWLWENWSKDSYDG